MRSKLEEFYINATEEDLKRVQRMGWEDRTPFEAMALFTGLSANEVIKLMRKILSAKDFIRWRKRANNHGALKHQKKRPKAVNRFKCSRERLDGSTKGHK